jgi:hypothetical protein
VKRFLRLAETAVAALLTITSIVLHVRATMSAGALWRDEANTVSLATLPTFADLWRNMEFDSFPLLWLLVVRAYGSLVGPMNDQAFRALGFVVGLALLSALWLNARTFRYNLPLVSLALLGLTPSLIVWGDSVRAYGLAMTLILVTNALIWRFVQHPSISRFVLASVSAVLSVNAVYYNAVLLLAFCAAGAVVCVRNKDPRKAILVISIGAVAAASLMTYRTQIGNIADWSMLVRVKDYSFTWFWYKLSDALLAGGPWAVAIWTQVFVLSLVLGVLAVKRTREFDLSVEQRDSALYGIVALAIGAPASFLFLDRLSYYTAPWYYLSLITLVAVCCDIIMGTVAGRPALRLSRVLAVIVIAAATLPTALGSVRTRLTNVDLIAESLETTARPGDVIVVSPWHNGVSFDRYYHGAASWITVPRLNSPALHRYDLVKQQMLMRDQTAPVSPAIERMASALAAGNKVYFVGTPMFPSPGAGPEILPPAPHGKPGWNTSAYDRQWAAILSHFLKENAATITQVPVESGTNVSHYENLTLLVAEGYRPRPMESRATSAR